MTSPLMKPTLVGRDTLHELDQPLKKLAYVSNHWGPLLLAKAKKTKREVSFISCKAMFVSYMRFCLLAFLLHLETCLV
ncbi:hypothetical protein VCRA2133E348_210080 [Vibrio crassostreae]|nr:hypothetical protein VCRA2119O48_200083 [Vibrio crassostreae]CAK2772880.1 hypothetical protein VCRA2133E348_210080 [Vibrio crassostreae]CAK3840592.1 hypothetical protein VCRA212O16_210083 [Vibrio crassostreae]